MRLGHRLKSLGVCTGPLSQTGDGLRFDNATVAEIQKLAAVFMM
jgi:hypothetical protein